MVTFNATKNHILRGKPHGKPLEMNKYGEKNRPHFNNFNINPKWSNWSWVNLEEKYIDSMDASFWKQRLERTFVFKC